MLKQLQDAIVQLKKEKNAAILAHSYQSPEILEIADLTGDSFVLSVKAKEVQADTIVLCGVRFMADTVKILNPEKTVLLPNATASCPMADQIDPQRVLDYKKEHPDCCCVAYINTSTALKAVCDVCVTSSSALAIVRAIEQKDILFIPDKNLGSWIQAQVPEKNITLWEGCCPIHDRVTAADCLAAKERWPLAKIAMHPECPPEALAHADLIGSTSAILSFAAESDGDVIIGTEKTIADWLSIQHPDRRFPLLTKNLMCPDMRVTTLTDVVQALEGTGGEEIVLTKEARLAAKRPIDAMIALNK